MGATAITNRVEDVVDNERVVTATVTFSNSYATGGDSISLDTLGLAHVREVTVVAPTNANGHGYNVTVDVSTDTAPKLLAWTGGGTPAQVTAATDLSAVSRKLRFYGT